MYRKSSLYIRESERTCMRTVTVVVPSLLRVLRIFCEVGISTCIQSSAWNYDGNHHSVVTHVCLCRALHVPIKSEQFRLRCASHRRSRLCFNFSWSYPMTRRNIFLDTRARRIRSQVSRRGILFHLSLLKWRTCYCAMACRASIFEA